MSVIDLSVDDKLEVLDDLQEDGRRRYLKRRTREELEEIVIAVWRERKAEKKLDGTLPALSIAEAASTFTLKLEKCTNLEHDEDERSAAIPYAQPQKPMNAMATELAIRGSAPQPQKRRAVSDPEDQRISPRKKVAGPWLRMLKARGQAPSMENTPKPLPVDLPILLHVPDDKGDFQYVSIDELPMPVYAELLKRFETFRTATLHKIQAYRTLSSNPRAYIHKKFCVCDQLTQGLSSTSNLAPPTYRMGGKIKIRADDKCIRDRIPCAHITERDGGFALYFVPLPMKAQKSDHWKDLGFWVRD